MAGRCANPVKGRRDVFSARERAVLSHQFYDDYMNGAKKGEILRATKKSIIYGLQWNAADKTVLWGVCLDRYWKRGTAIHVSAAVEQIAYLIDNKELLKKLETLELEASAEPEEEREKRAAKEARQSV